MALADSHLRGTTTFQHISVSTVARSQPIVTQRLQFLKLTRIAFQLGQAYSSLTPADIDWVWIYKFSIKDIRDAFPKSIATSPHRVTKYV
jgi:hypothetical protein